MAPFVEFDLAVIIHSTTESVQLYGTPVSIGGKTPNMLTVRSGRQTVSCRGLAVPGARNTHFSIATYHNAGRYIDQYIEDLHVYGIPEFIPISKMLKNWKHEIVNSFLTYRGRRISNGPVESMNSRIKLIKRNANGYKNFYRFRLRCLYTLNKETVK